ncbi:hypothetical protein BGZ94_007806 [Podila epigama]|nr:hypothetical protein BGZ94_007806 [Podila epigama]
MFCQDANDAFKDDYERGLDLCALKELDIPDTEFATIVAPLVEIAESSAMTDVGVKAQSMHHQDLSYSIFTRLRTILPLSGRPQNNSDHYLAELRTRQKVMLGEQGLAAARQSNMDLLDLFGIVAGTRKCDSIMTVDNLEIANFELKKGMCTDIKDDIQLRRTIKAMKSIMLMLNKFSLDCPPVCCMRGVEATIFSVKKLDDIWVAGPACDKIILPQTEAEILDFMKNDMHRLFNLLVLYDRYSREVLVKKAEYERRLRRNNKVALTQLSEAAGRREGENHYGIS